MQEETPAPTISGLEDFVYKIFYESAAASLFLSRSPRVVETSV